MKHGAISHIEDGTLVIGVSSQPESTVVEGKSCGAYLCAITTYAHYRIEATENFIVYVSNIDEHFATSLAVIPLQLMGYYLPMTRGIDVYKSRNLAKSVSIEIKK